MTDIAGTEVQQGRPQEKAISSFVDYRRAVREVLNDLSTLREHAVALKLDGAASQAAAVLERLESDRFSVAVVGEFKRGKSTFINALLGADALPTDVLPCSATLNRVTYGLTKRAVLEYKDGKTQDIPFERLSDYVTKLTAESEEKARSIAKATIYYPSPYCEKNVDVIDTPGLNEDEAMTQVTLGVLPEVDAAILVIRAQAPFSEYERRFLETRLLSADLGRVIFVVNGIDQISSSRDVDRIVAAVEKRVAENVVQRAKRQFGEDSDEYRLALRKLGKLRVFGLSAFQALDGKLRGDHETIQRSRFGAFERELQRFLTEGRGAASLQVPLNRTMFSAGELLATLATHEAALRLKSDDFERAAAESEAEVSKLRKSKADELATIERASAQLQLKVGTLADSFVADFKRAVLDTISSADIDNDDISGDEARRLFDQKLGGEIASATSTVVDRYSDELRREVESALTQAAQRVETFEVALSGLLSRIAQRFTGMAEEPSSPAGHHGETTAALIATLTGLGGIWGGYRSAGWKGAGVGAAASIGCSFAGGFALALIGAPITLPVIAVMGVASFFTGRWAADALFRKSRIENYRNKLLEEAASRLESDMSPEQIRENFQRTAEQALLRFRDRVEESAEAVLQDAASTLLRLREKYAEGRARTEAELATSASMRREIEDIITRARKHSAQIAACAAEW